MNVQVHHAVTDLTGETGMRIVRAIMAGERDPRKLVALRHRRYQKSPAEFAACLTATWREKHLFNLEGALQMHGAVQERIAAYERPLLDEMEAVQPEERREAEPPPHPNPRKEASLKTNGQQGERPALWRVTVGDLTRIDGLSTGGRAHDPDRGGTGS